MIHLVFLGVVWAMWRLPVWARSHCPPACESTPSRSIWKRSKAQNFSTKAQRPHKSHKEYRGIYFLSSLWASCDLCAFVVSSSVFSTRRRCRIRSSTARNFVFSRSRKRTHDLTLDILQPLDPAAAKFTHSHLPHIAQRLVEAKTRAARILMMGAHVLRAGTQRHLIDLMEPRPREPHRNERSRSDSRLGIRTH